MATPNKPTVSASNFTLQWNKSNPNTKSQAYNPKLTGCSKSTNYRTWIAPASNGNASLTGDIWNHTMTSSQTSYQSTSAKIAPSSILGKFAETSKTVKLYVCGAAFKTSAASAGRTSKTGYKQVTITLGSSFYPMLSTLSSTPKLYIKVEEWNRFVLKHFPNKIIQGKSRLTFRTDCLSYMVTTYGYTGLKSYTAKIAGLTLGTTLTRTSSGAVRSSFYNSYDTTNISYYNGTGQGVSDDISYAYNSTTGRYNYNWVHPVKPTTYTPAAAGTWTPSISCVDNRGFTASKNVPYTNSYYQVNNGNETYVQTDISTFKVYAYKNIRINSIIFQKCNQDGTYNLKGEYFKVLVSYSIYGIENLNAGELQMTIKDLVYTNKSDIIYSTSLTTNTNADKTATYVTPVTAIIDDTTYEITVYCHDYLSSVEKSIKASTMIVPLDLKGDGQGLAFGAYAINEGYTSHFNSFYRQNCYIEEDSLTVNGDNSYSVLRTFT